MQIQSQTKFAFHWFRKEGKNMTVDITWAKDKRDITTHNTQTKTFKSNKCNSFCK